MGNACLLVLPTLESKKKQKKKIDGRAVAVAAQIVFKSDSRCSDCTVLMVVVVVVDTGCRLSVLLGRGEPAVLLVDLDERLEALLRSR